MFKISVIGSTEGALITILILLPIILSSGISAFGQDNASQPDTNEQPPLSPSLSPSPNDTTEPDGIETPPPDATETTPTGEAEEATPTLTTAESAPSPPLVENQVVSIFQNQTVSIPLSPGDSRLKYIISEFPIHGEIIGVDKTTGELGGNIAIYVPNTNFIGDDSFQYFAQNSTQNIIQNSEVAMVTIKVNEPPTPIIDDIATRNALSFTIAIIAVVVITLVAKRIITRLQSLKYPDHKSKFLDIIRGQDMVPSLSVFQFLLWTYVLMFALIGVYFVRIFGGVSDPPQGPLPVYLLAIKGISVTTPIVSSLISSYRFSSAPSFEYGSQDESHEAGEEIPPPVKKPAFGEMLRLNDKPTLSRFQMFAWTWISIGIYLSVLFSTVGETSNSVWNLTVPDIDPMLVGLMGLSQVAFLGLKTTGSTGIQISKIFPLHAKPKQIFSIFGKNFGEERQIVWIGTERQITSTDHENLIFWSGDRIDIRIPEDIPLGRSYQIMVVKGGASKIAKDRVYVQSSPSTSGSTEPGATDTKLTS